MPPRRSTRRTVPAELHPDQLAHLQHGWVFFHDGPAVLGYGTPTFPFRDPAHRRELWEQHRDLLLANVYGFELDQPQEPRAAGTRPHAWWSFDAPGPRLDDEAEPAALDRLGCLSGEERAALGLTSGIALPENCAEADTVR